MLCLPQVEGKTLEKQNTEESWCCSCNLELERRQDAGIAVELRTCYANILPSLLSESSHGHLHATSPHAVLWRWPFPGCGFPGCSPAHLSGLTCHALSLFILASLAFLADLSTHPGCSCLFLFTCVLTGILLPQGSLP